MSRPDFEFEKLSKAIRLQGLPLEVEAFSICRRHDWVPVHGYRYGPADDTREIDVLASRRIAFDDSGQAKRLTGTGFVVIECKFATGWWVFTSLSDAPPRYDEYLFPGPGGGVADLVLVKIVEAVLKDMDDEPIPARTWSVREVSFNYKRPDREQFYSASLQALSAVRGHAAYQAGSFSLQSPILRLFAPVVLTSGKPVVARFVEEGDSPTFEEVDWVIHGAAPDIVHVVTGVGLDRLLTFYDRAIEALNSPGAHQLIWSLFKS